MAISGRSYSTVKVGNGTTIKIEYRNFAESTASIAREYAQHGYPDKYVIVTENQASTTLTGTNIKAGSLDHGIFMSLVLRPSFFPEQAASLDPISVVAFAQVLEKYTSKQLGISWVSDIFCDGVKIGGTKIEGKLKDTEAYDYIIITFAAKLDENDFPPRLKESVRKVFTKNNLPNGLMIAKTVLDNFFKAYTNVQSIENAIKQYENKFILKGIKIKYLHKKMLRAGTVIGIDKDTFSLTVKPTFGEQTNISKHSATIIPSRIKQIVKKQTK